MRVAFDLDGTLFDCDVGVRYDDPESIRAMVRPHVAACRGVGEMAREGMVVAYVTGRSEPVRAVTEAQIIGAGLPLGTVHMQRTWGGFETMAEFKAAALRAFGAHVYVGDHEADKRAALRAGASFVHADDFRARPTLLLALEVPHG